MKRNTLLYIFFFTLIAIGCLGEEDKTEKFEKIISGKYCEPTAQNTEYCKFYNNKGVLIKEGEYSQGIPIGFVKYYSQNGSLKMAIEYILISSDSSVDNRFYKFNPSGDTLYNQSSFYSFVIEKDSINLGDTLVVHFDLPGSLWDDNIVEYYFDLPNRNEKRLLTPSAGETAIKYLFVPLKKGEHIISGVVSDIDSTETARSNYKVSRDMIFKFKYWVL